MGSHGAQRSRSQRSRAFGHPSPARSVLLAGLLAACGSAPAPGAPGAGDTLLAPQFGSVRRSEAYGLAPHRGGAYVVGRTWDTLYTRRLGNADAFLAKYDAAGTLVWGRQFGTANMDDAWDVSSDAHDNAYVVGRRERGSTNTYDLVLHKFTAGGALAWSRTVGAAGSGNGGGGVAADRGGNVYVPVTSFGRAMLVKYGPDGTPLWSIRDHSSGAPAVADIAVTPDGAVYLAGTNRDGMVITKVSPDGITLWRRSVHFQEFTQQQATAVAVAGDHVYLIGHFLWQPTGERKSLVTKFTADGTQQWQQPYHNLRGTDLAMDASVDAGGNLYLAGYRSGGPHPVSVGFVSKIGSAGGYPLWIRTVESSAGAFTFGMLVSTTAGPVLTPSLIVPFPRLVTEVYEVGYASGPVGDGHTGTAFLRRLNSVTGDTLWTR